MGHWTSVGKMCKGAQSFAKKRFKTCREKCKILKFKSVQKHIKKARHLDKNGCRLEEGEDIKRIALQDYLLTKAENCIDNNNQVQHTSYASRSIPPAPSVESAREGTRRQRLDRIWSCHRHSALPPATIFQLHGWRTARALWGDEKFLLW